MNNHHVKIYKSKYKAFRLRVIEAYADENGFTKCYFCNKRKATTAVWRDTSSWDFSRLLPACRGCFGPIYRRITAEVYPNARYDV